MFRNSYFNLICSILFLVLTINCHKLLAAENEQGTILNNFWNGHFKSTIKDGWDLEGISILGTGALAGYISHKYYDQKVKNHFNKKRRLGETLTDFGNSLGTRYINIIIAAGQMYWDTSNGFSHMESLLYTTILVYPIKMLVHRTRPNGENEDSFPSGHTSGAFASSGSLSYAYGWKAAIPAYTLTSITLLARLEDNKHWLSDVLVATSIGIFCARASGIHHGYLSPIVLKEGGGVAYNYAF